MRTLSTLFLTVALCGATVTPVPLIPPCTVVAVQTVDPVNSATAHPGDFFRFRTINTVAVNNTVAIPARTLGWGIVAVASPAGRGGRAGFLVLEPRYFVLPSGKFGVVLDHNTADMQRSGASNNLPGYLGAIPVPGIGIALGAFNYFHHGRDVTLPPGTVFTVFPSDDPRVSRCQQGPENR